ncbi:MAG TPA: sigma 54-interacting transcriptional regulator [Kofleriaceae bacterium]
MTRDADTGSTEVLEAREPRLDDGSARPFVVLFQGGERRVIALDDTRRCVVGRSRDADVHVEDGAVSRRHLAIAIQAGAVVVEDLESSNGTYVNGERIAERCTLGNGDIVTAGRTQIVAHCAQRTAGGAQPLDPLLDPLLDPPRDPSRDPPRDQPLDPRFAQRLEAEMYRALRHRRPVSVIELVAADLRALETPGPPLRAIDVVERTAGRLTVMLPETPSAAAEDTARALIRRLAAAGSPARAGVAGFPDHAYDAASLRSAARDAVDRAAAGEVLRAGGALAEVPIGAGTVAFADPAMVQLVSLVRRLARTELPLSITGETGVGKEIFARMLHALSPRSAGPFVVVNCPAIPESLAESELFGHVRGAFSGADRDLPGALESSHGGTVFLDEVADMPLGVQAKLLRFLDDKQVTPVGARQAIALDVRVVAATNGDLREAIAAGRFRADLFHRLSGAALVIPPLRERPRDVPVLFRRFAAELCSKLGRPALAVAAETDAALAAHGWPGNVRELRHAVEHAVAFAESVIEPAHLPFPSAGAAPPGSRSPPDLHADVAELERRRILETLERTGGNQTQAARLLGISRMTLSQRLDDYGVPRPRKKSGP